MKELELEIASWNDEHIAFIKNDPCKHQWTIFNADGKQLASVADRDHAFLMARQNNYEPKSVH